MRPCSFEQLRNLIPILQSSCQVSKDQEDDLAGSGDFDVVDMLEKVHPMLKRGEHVKLILYWCRGSSPTRALNLSEPHPRRLALETISHPQMGINAIFFHGKDKKITQSVMNGLVSLDFHGDGNFFAVEHSSKSSACSCYLMKATGILLSSAILRDERRAKGKDEGQLHKELFGKLFPIDHEVSKEEKVHVIS